MLCTLIRHHLPSYMESTIPSIPSNLPRKSDLFQLFTAMDNLADGIHETPLEAVFQNAFGCGGGDLQRLVERMTFAAVEAASQAATAGQ